MIHHVCSSWLFALHMIHYVAAQANAAADATAAPAAVAAAATELNEACSY
jgi:hypothetical protein